MSQHKLFKVLDFVEEFLCCLSPLLALCAGVAAYYSNYELAIYLFSGALGCIAVGVYQWDIGYRVIYGTINRTGRTTHSGSASDEIGV